MTPGSLAVTQLALLFDLYDMTINLTIADRHQHIVWSAV